MNNMYKTFDLKTLEREYSPSSCVDDISPYLLQYITLSQNNLKIAKQHKQVVENLRYGRSNDEVLDLFLPFSSIDSQKKLHVYIHGGYWQELSKNESCFAANNFQENGYHFAVLNYSLAPKATLTQIIEQCRQAIAWLYQHAENYGYNKNDIYLSGSSAGAHLAMMMALTDWSKYLPVNHNIITGICAVSGIYDLTPIAQTYINDPLKLTELEILENSPLFLSGNYKILAGCQITLAFGDNETSEFKRQTLEIKSLLEGSGLTLSFNEIANRNHFDVILDIADPSSWLGKQTLLK